MKNSLKAMTAGLVVAAALTVSAAAADFDHCADALNQMGLFQGGTSGYELDRAPTRAEAATMLVRMLGKEADAKALTYTAPFTDLEDWEKPYVQYLYDAKLTNGATATTFDPESKCDAQMYSTFLLRALGYSDAAEGDFTYDKAVDKATELGVVDMVNCDTKNFLRDNVVAMSYTALSVEPKDKSADTLLAKLVADGAVDSAKAQPTLDLFKNFKEYESAATKQNDVSKMAMDMDMAMSAKLNGKDFMTMKSKMAIKANMDLEDLNKSKMAMDGTMDIEMDKSLVENEADAKLSQDLKYYYTDGNMYMQLGEDKVKMPMDFSQAQAMINSTKGVSSEPVSAIKALTKSGDTYTVEYAPAVMNSMMDTMLKGMNMDAVMQGVTFKMDTFKMNATVKDGMVSAMDMAMGMTAGAEGQALDMDITVKANVTATGDSVKVELPADLDTYTVPAAAE
ncbi:S-layer homology domain-containing protein [Intestinibacillus massiliensis]|nr:S-layer homology domain-containing protein [Intestinibacillus massiliensis]